MVRNVQATTASGLRKNRVTQKTRLRIVRGQLDVEAAVLDDEEERNRVLASQGVDAEDVNEHHLQAVLSAANQRKHTGGLAGKQLEAHIPTPDAAGVVEAYESLYPPDKYKPPTTHLRFSQSVEESVECGLAGGFTYFLDERDAEWIDKNNQEARGEGTSSSASASANGSAGEDITATSRRTRSAKGKSKEPDQHTGLAYHEQDQHPRVVVDEDEFELVMGLFEKFTEDRIPFIHLALDAFPPFADYELMFATLLSPATFAGYVVPSSVPPPERLVLVAKAVYGHWRERKVERKGKRVVPQLDYDDTHESSYICFRRRDAKPVRRTRASSTAYTDKLARLRSELQTGLELAKLVLERERAKQEAADAAQGVWRARCKLVEGWRPGDPVDEALLFDRERLPKKPRVEGPGRIILGLNRRPQGVHSGSGTPSGDPHSPLTAHLDLSVVNLSALTPLAYVAVQSAVRERCRDVQASVEREMASLRAGDNGWEDLVDMPYQPAAVPYSDKMFRPAAPPARASPMAPSSFGIDRAATLLNSEIPPPIPADPTSTSSSSDKPSTSAIPFTSPQNDTIHHPQLSSLSPQYSKTERPPRSLRLRTGRGGRLHLDRRLHSRRVQPLLSVVRAGWPREASSASSALQRVREEQRWQGRDWRPEQESPMQEGQSMARVLGEEYWAHESMHEDGTILGKRKRLVGDETVQEKRKRLVAYEDEECIGFEQSGYGLGLATHTEWENGPADEMQWKPEPRSRDVRGNSSEPEDRRDQWYVEGRPAEQVEQAWRIEERWRYDSDPVRDEDDRFLLDDFQPKFLRTMITLLDVKDHEAVKTDPRRLEPPLVPESSSRPFGAMEQERVRLTSLKIQRVPHLQPQSSPLSSDPQRFQPQPRSTTPPLPPPQQRIEDQIRRIPKQPIPDPSAAAAGNPQANQRVALASHRPSTPAPAQGMVGANASPLKQQAFANGIVGDGGATVRVSSPVRPKSHTPTPHAVQQSTPALAVNGFTNGVGFPAHQHQTPLILHPGHAHGLNPQQYATLRNVFAERVPAQQQPSPGRSQIHVNGVGNVANVNLQMGPGNLNLKLPPTRAVQLKMNGPSAGLEVNGATTFGGPPVTGHMSPSHPAVNGSPVAHARATPPATNGLHAAHLIPQNHGRASPMGHHLLSNSPHHHSNLTPLHASPPPRLTPVLAHQQAVGAAGQGHGY